MGEKRWGLGCQRMREGLLAVAKALAQTQLRYTVGLGQAHPHRPMGLYEVVEKGGEMCLPLIFCSCSRGSFTTYHVQWHVVVDGKKGRASLCPPFYDGTRRDATILVRAWAGHGPLCEPGAEQCLSMTGWLPSHTSKK